MEELSLSNKLQKISTKTLSESDKQILVEADKEHEEKIKFITRRSIYNDMKIPHEYREKSFKSFGNRDKAERIKRIIDLKYSLVLSGTPGLGKTHLAIASMIFMMNRYENGRPLFLSAPDLFVELRDRIENKTTERSIIDRYITVPLLVVDDLGVEKQTARSVETFYSIIDGRQRASKQLIITTELTIEEISEIYGDRLSSRLCGMGEYIRLDGEDHRIKMQRERKI